MPAALETSYLLPNATFYVELGVLLLAFVTLVAWPFVETVRRRQWGYTLGVVVLGPIGGLAWLLGGRRATA